jgi:hypothetical protein
MILSINNFNFSGSNERDVFNEKPSKEELISATQVKITVVISNRLPSALSCSNLV